MSRTTGELGVRIDASSPGAAAIRQVPFQGMEDLHVNAIVTGNPSELELDLFLHPNFADRHAMGPSSRKPIVSIPPGGLLDGTIYSACGHSASLQWPMDPLLRMLVQPPGHPYGFPNQAPDSGTAPPSSLLDIETINGETRLHLDLTQCLLAPAGYGALRPHDLVLEVRSHESIAVIEELELFTSARSSAYSWDSTSDGLADGGRDVYGPAASGGSPVTVDPDRDGIPASADMDDSKPDILPTMAFDFRQQHNGELTLLLAGNVQMKQIRATADGERHLGVTRDYTDGAARAIVFNIKDTTAGLRFHLMDQYDRPIEIYLERESGEFSAAVMTFQHQNVAETWNWKIEIDNPTPLLDFLVISSLNSLGVIDESTQEEVIEWVRGAGLPIIQAATRIPLCDPDDPNCRKLASGKTATALTLRFAAALYYRGQESAVIQTSPEGRITVNQKWTDADGVRHYFMVMPNFPYGYHGLSVADAQEIGRTGQSFDSAYSTRRAIVTDSSYRFIESFSGEYFIRGASIPLQDWESLWERPTGLPAGMRYRIEDTTMTTTLFSIERHLMEELYPGETSLEAFACHMRCWSHKDQVREILTGPDWVKPTETVEESLQTFRRGFHVWGMDDALDLSADSQFVRPWDHAPAENTLAMASVLYSYHMARGADRGTVGADFENYWGDLSANAACFTFETRGCMQLTMEGLLPEAGPQEAPFEILFNDGATIRHRDSVVVEGAFNKQAPLGVAQEGRSLASSLAQLGSARVSGDGIAVAFDLTGAERWRSEGPAGGVNWTPGVFVHEYT